MVLLLPLASEAETLRVPGPDGILLNAELYAPPRGVQRGPAILALHGCSGPYPSRDAEWGRRLAAAGHLVVMPDSFGSRGLGSQCGNRARGVTASGVRRDDALAVARWLQARPGTPPGGVVLLGWSDGGTTVLAAGRAAADLPAGLIRGLVAFYPGCRGFAESAKWAPAAPLMILMGESDDWTPFTPCKALADRVGGKITLVAYQNTYHDFDAPDRPVTLRTGLARPKDGVAHVGTNAAAREDAFRRVPEFIAGLPPAS